METRPRGGSSSSPRELAKVEKGGEGVWMSHTGPVAIVAKTVGIPRAITPPIPDLGPCPASLLDDVRPYFDSLLSVSFTRNEAPLVDGGKARG